MEEHLFVSGTKKEGSKKVRTGYDRTANATTVFGVVSYNVPKPDPRLDNHHNMQPRYVPPFLSKDVLQTFMNSISKARVFLPTKATRE